MNLHNRLKWLERHGGADDQIVYAVHDDDSGELVYLMLREERRVQGDDADVLLEQARRRGDPTHKRYGAGDDGGSWLDAP